MNHLNDLYYVAVILIAAGVGYYLGIFTGAHYVPTTDSVVEKMLDLAELKAGERFADLGSGDGKLLIAAAQRGAVAHGYEINPLLVWWSRMRLRRAGFAGKAFVHWKSFWRQDFSGFDVVTVYGISHIMGLLEKKLLTELYPGPRIVCNSFPFPTWQGRKEGGLYLYER